MRAAAEAGSSRAQRLPVPIERRSARATALGCSRRLHPPSGPGTGGPALRQTGYTAPPRAAPSPPRPLRRSPGHRAAGRALSGAGLPVPNVDRGGFLLSLPLSPSLSPRPAEARPPPGSRPLAPSCALRSKACAQLRPRETSLQEKSPSPRSAPHSPMPVSLRPGVRAETNPVDGGSQADAGAPPCPKARG